MFNAGLAWCVAMVTITTTKIITNFTTCNSIHLMCYCCWLVHVQSVNLHNNLGSVNSSFL